MLVLQAGKLWGKFPFRDSNLCDSVKFFFCNLIQLHYAIKFLRIMLSLLTIGASIIFSSRCYEIQVSFAVLFLWSHSLHRWLLSEHVVAVPLDCWFDVLGMSKGVENFLNVKVFKLIYVFFDDTMGMLEGVHDNHQVCHNLECTQALCPGMQNYHKLPCSNCPSLKWP